MGEKQRVKSVHYFPFFSLFYATQFSRACNFRLFSLFFRWCLGSFLSFLRVGAIATYIYAIAVLYFFCYRGLWRDEWFPRRKRVFNRWVRRWVLIG